MSMNVIEIMRQWVAEVVWNGEQPDWVAILPQACVVETVARHYDGGVEQFLADCREPEVVPIAVASGGPVEQSTSVEVPVRVIIQGDLINPEDLL